MLMLDTLTVARLLAVSMLVPEGRSLELAHCVGTTDQLSGWTRRTKGNLCPRLLTNTPALSIPFCRLRRFHSFRAFSILARSFEQHPHSLLTAITTYLFLFRHS